MSCLHFFCKPWYFFSDFFLINRKFNRTAFVFNINLLWQYKCLYCQIWSVKCILAVWKYYYIFFKNIAMTPNIWTVAYVECFCPLKDHSWLFLEENTKRLKVWRMAVIMNHPYTPSLSRLSLFLQYAWTKTQYVRNDVRLLPLEFDI